MASNLGSFIDECPIVEVVGTLAYAPPSWQQQRDAALETELESHAANGSSAVSWLPTQPVREVDVVVLLAD